MGYEGTFGAVDGSAAGFVSERRRISSRRRRPLSVARSSCQGTGTIASDFAMRGPARGHAGPGQRRTTLCGSGRRREPARGARPPLTRGCPNGCIATRYSGFFIRAAGVRVNGERRALSRDDPEWGSDRVAHARQHQGGRARVLSGSTAACSATSASRHARHEVRSAVPAPTPLTITLAGKGRTTTITRRFRFRDYTITSCQARRVVGRIRPAHATVEGTGVTVRAIVPPTITGGAKLRFVITSAHAAGSSGRASRSTGRSYAASTR